MQSIDKSLSIREKIEQINQIYSQASFTPDQLKERLQLLSKNQAIFPSKNIEYKQRSKSKQYYRELIEKKKGDNFSKQIKMKHQNSNQQIQNSIQSKITQNVQQKKQFHHFEQSNNKNLQKNNQSLFSNFNQREDNSIKLSKISQPQKSTQHLLFKYPQKQNYQNNQSNVYTQEHKTHMFNNQITNDINSSLPKVGSTNIQTTTPNLFTKKDESNLPFASNVQTTTPNLFTKKDESNLPFASNVQTTTPNLFTKKDESNTTTLNLLGKKSESDITALNISAKNIEATSTPLISFMNVDVLKTQSFKVQSKSNDLSLPMVNKPNKYDRQHYINKNVQQLLKKPIKIIEIKQQKVQRAQTQQPEDKKQMMCSSPFLTKSTFNQQQKQSQLNKKLQQLKQKNNAITNTSIFPITKITVNEINLTPNQNQSINKSNQTKKQFIVQAKTQKALNIFNIKPNQQIQKSDSKTAIGPNGKKIQILPINPFFGQSQSKAKQANKQSTIQPNLFKNPLQPKPFASNPFANLKTGQAGPNIFSKAPQNQISIFPAFSLPGNNTKNNTSGSLFNNNQNDSQQQGDDDQDLLKQQEDKSDPKLSLKNYQYEKTQILFKQNGVKYRQQNKQTVQNTIISIQRLNNDENKKGQKYLFIRFANKCLAFSGLILPNLTEIRSLNNSSKNIEIKKIMKIEGEKKKLTSIKVQFKDQALGNKFIEEFSKTETLNKNDQNN